MIKRITTILGLIIVLLLIVSTAFAGTSLPPTTKTTTGSYNGTFNSLGVTPVYYSNYNVKPTSTSMSMWVTGKMNNANATSDFYSGNGRMSNSTQLGYTRLYNFNGTETLSRNANYNNSFNTSYYYWSSFNLVNRNMVAQLVGNFTFKSN